MDNATTILPIEDLPELVLEEILSMLDYHEVATFRRINRRFNNIGTSILNKGYKSTKLQHAKLYEAVKTELTWKQNKFTKSEPLMYHVLIRHYDVLTTIERHLTISKIYQPESLLFYSWKGHRQDVINIPNNSRR